MAIIAVLSLGLLLTGCPDGGKDTETVEAQGKVLILQAYGNAGDGSPAGVSHSFVELYNISDKVLLFKNGTPVFLTGRLLKKPSLYPQVTRPR